MSTDSTAGGLSGTSHDCVGDSSEETSAVNTKILAADGTEAWYEAGRGNPAMSVKGWLAVANISLDQENPIPADGKGCDGDPRGSAALPDDGRGPAHGRVVLEPP